MTLVDRVNRQRSLTAASRTRRFGRIAANASVPTTTYSYDANGNVIQAGGWSYVWDYLNRMLASGYNNSTTTYAYDQTGARVLQTSTTSTAYYPSKFFSLASTTNGGTSWATSTNYIWLGDTLLGTIDQKLYNGSATGTAITRYIHPDHLGSTNVVTDASGTVVQLLDYYPYGATRISSTTYPTSEKRQYIGQLYDQGTGLNYLNARYYNALQAQFLSEDPVFWNSRQNLADPQSLNVYSYANDNPINRSDPSGLASIKGTTSEILSQLKSQLQSAGAFLASLSTSAGRTQFANNIAGGASLVRSNPIGVASAYGSAIRQGVSQTVRDLYDRGDDKALASSIIFFGSIAIPDSEAGQLAARAKEINGVVDPIAQSMRTTAVLRTTAGDIVASGGRDLTKAQIASLRAGEVSAAPMPGAHAEVTAITDALNSGSTPQTLGVSRQICSECKAFIQSKGGTIMDPFTASW